MTAAPLTAAVGAMIVNPDGKVRNGSVDLEWSLADPIVVRMTFRIGDGDSVEWLVSRDLLAGGIGSHLTVGRGDVRVRALTERSTCIRLAPPGDYADVMIPTADLIAFVDACESVCEAGSPAEAERMAAWVEAMLLTWPRLADGSLGEWSA